MKAEILTCIGCSNACEISIEKIECDEIEYGEVEKSEDESEFRIEGYSCPRGKAFALETKTEASRTLTESVPVLNGTPSRIMVRTAQKVPKEKFKAVLLRLRALELKAPIYEGTVVCENIAGTGIDVIALQESV